MGAADELRQLLIADLALMRGTVKAHQVAAALMGSWDPRGEGGPALLDELARIANIDRGAFAEVEAEAERLIAAADGNPESALSRRGGIDRSIHIALSAERADVSRVISTMSGGIRTPLRQVPEGRYIDFELSGQGGMGLVYWAIDTELNRQVAFKIVRPDAATGAPALPPNSPIHAALPDRDTPASEAFETLKARFLQEAWITGGMEHPGIVPVYELGKTARGVPYYTMRFVRGQRTLGDALTEAQGGGFETRLKLLEPFLRLCDTVAYAHAKGVTHRDIKPANVALGEFGEVVVLDWGLAKLEGRPDVAASLWQAQIDQLRSAADLKTRVGAIGTPGYMAPEAAAGKLAELDAQSDVFSLGAVLFEILTGRLPFQLTDTYAEYVAQLLRGEAPQPRAVEQRIPQPLEAICREALARDKPDRTPSVGALAASIRSWQAQSALDHEVDRLVAEAEGALDAADAEHGASRLRQVDRAMAALQQVRTKAALDPRAQRLDERAGTLRARGLREHARRNRIAALIGAGVLLAVIAALLLVIDTLSRQRTEAVRLRQIAEREEHAKGYVIRYLDATLRGLDAEADGMGPRGPRGPSVGSISDLPRTWQLLREGDMPRAAKALSDGTGLQPWKIADELCGAGDYANAERIAVALPGADTAAIPTYVARQRERGAESAAVRRGRLDLRYAEVIASKRAGYEEALAALGAIALPTDAPGALRVRILHMKAYAHWGQKEFKAAEQEYLASLPLIRTLGWIAYEQQTNRLLSLVAYKLGGLDRAVTYGIAAREVAVARGRPSLEIAHSDVLVGTLANLAQQYDVAVHYMGAAIEVFERDSPDAAEAGVLATYGTSLVKAGKREAGARVIARAIGMAEGSGNNALLWELLYQQAEALPIAAHPAEALVLLRRSEALVKEVKDERTGFLLTHLAEALLALGKQAEAERYAKRAIEVIQATAFGPLERARALLEEIRAGK